MGLMNKLREMHDNLVRLALEPERLDAWLEHLAGCGVQGEVEWRPHDLIDAKKGTGRSGWPLCYGKLRLQNTAIDRIHFIKGQMASSTSSSFIVKSTTRQKIMYEDRFYIDAQAHLPVADVRAKRRPKRAYWIFGKILGWRWKGGRFAQKLAADRLLNDALLQNDEGKITIRYNKRQRAYCIRRPYIGMTTTTTSGMFTGFKGEINPEYHFPAKEALQAYHRIAQYVRAEAGLPQKH